MAVMEIVSLVGASMSLAQQFGAKVHFNIPSDLPASDLKQWLQNKIKWIDNVKIPELERQKTGWNILRNIQLDDEIAQNRKWRDMFKEMIPKVEQIIEQEEAKKRTVASFIGGKAPALLSGVGVGGANTTIIIIITGAIILFILFILILLK